MVDDSAAPNPPGQQSTDSPARAPGTPKQPATERRPALSPQKELAPDVHPPGRARPTQPPRHHKLIPSGGFDTVKDMEQNPDSNTSIDSHLAQLCKDCGGIGGLVAMLSNTDPTASTQAAWVLRCLVSPRHDKRGELAKLAAKAVAEGVVAGLVKLLNNDTKGAQYQPEVALRNLAEVSSEMADIVAAGACPSLVALLSGGSVTTQESAVGVLLRLARSSNRTVEKIAASGAIPPLVALLSSSSETAQPKALHVLLYLAGAKAPEHTCVMPLGVPYEKHKAEIAAAGAIKLLVALLSRGSAESQEQAARLLGSLASHSDECKTEMVASGAIAPLVALLSSGSEGSQEQAARALERLAWSSKQLKAQICAFITSNSAVVPLIALLSTGSANSRERAARMLGSVARHSEEGQTKTIAAGAVAPLVVLLTKGSAGGQEQAVKALERLAWSMERVPGVEQLRALSARAHVCALINGGGATVPLIALLSSGSANGQERAARLLGGLARHSDECKTKMVAASAIEPLVALLSSGSTGGQEQAANALERLTWSNEQLRARTCALIAGRGAIAPLVALLSSGFAGAQEQAANVLQRLAWRSEERKLRIAAAGGVVPLVALLSASSSSAQEAAAKVLVDLAAGSERRKVQIAWAGAIKPLVALLSSKSEGVKVQAEEALKRLACVRNLRCKRLPGPKGDAWEMHR